MSDIGTVVWKELVEMLHTNKKTASMAIVSLIMPIVMVLALSVTVPNPWFLVAFAVFFGPMFAFVQAIALVPDVVAGERERHTLETLLASRLSEPAIIYGKVLAALVAALGLAAVNFLLSILTIVIRYGDPRLFVALPLGLATFVPSAIIAFFFACLGAMISCRAATVQQAAQYSMMVLFAILFAPLILIGFAPKFGPAIFQALERFDALDWITLTLSVGVAFLAAGALAAWGARAMFRRSTLLARQRA